MRTEILNDPIIIFAIALCIIVAIGLYIVAHLWFKKFPKTHYFYTSEKADQEEAEVEE